LRETHVRLIYEPAAEERQTVIKRKTVVKSLAGNARTRLTNTLRWRHRGERID
jgi:hypothetical protein